MKKRKVCVVITNRASYARVKYLMKYIKKNPALELQLIVGASTLLFRFGKVIDIMQRNGFSAQKKLYYVIEGENLETQAKSTGLGIIELSTAFEDLKPDIVVTVADRFETIATAIAATYLNIPLAHIQGGEISGNIDNRVRHAITKLADLHFVATRGSKERVIRMGENPEYVFNFGCPSMDILAHEDLGISNKIMHAYGGTGKIINWEKPFILMAQHPVTTSYGKGFEQINHTFAALEKFKNYQKVVIWPNIDAGTDDVSKGIRIFRESHRKENFHYYRNFTPEDYARLLNNCICAVGNSSSFIREGSFLGTPAVIVGDRQKGREHGTNVIFSDYDSKSIVNKVKSQVKHGRYPPNKIFGNGNAGKKIADKISNVKLENTKKTMY